MKHPRIGESLRKWFSRFGRPNLDSSEEAVLEDFSTLNTHLAESDKRQAARARELHEVEARLGRLEIQSRRDE